MKHYAINFYKYTYIFTLLFFFGNIVSAQVSSFPYEEDFESGAGGWTLNFNNTSSWQLGSPVASIINSAASGSNAWVTNLAGSYFPDEDGYLLSPEFDFSLMVNPYVEFSLWWNSEGDWDGAVLQSSTDNQVSWQNVGTVGSGNNWFNTVEIASYPGGQPQGWSGSKDLDGNDSGGWLTVSQDIFHLIGETSVFFRLAFASDNIIQDEGIGFDLFKIYNNCNISITNSPQDIAIQYDSAGNYQTEIDDWLAVNGGAEASSDCGEITWSYNIFEFFVQSSNNRIVYGVEFIATDIFGNTDSSVIDLTVDGVNHFSDDIYGTGETICDDVFDLNTVITDIDPTASLNASDIVSFSFTRVPNGEPNEGPAGASFVDTEVDFPDTGAGSYTYLFKVSVQKSLAVYNPNTGELEEDFFEDEANITLNDKTVAFETAEFIGSEPSNTISSIQDLTDLLTISPDPDVLIPQNGPIDLNQYWTPSVYSGAGTYTFDPTNAFPNCPSNAVSITVCDIISINQPAQDLILNYDGNGNQTQVNNWLNNIGGTTFTSFCGSLGWDYEILENNLIDSNSDFVDDQLTVLIEFIIWDDFSSVITTASIIYNDFATAGESAGNGDTICESTYPVSDLDDGLSFPGGGANYEDAKYSSSFFEIQQLDGAPGLGLAGTNIDFPDTGAGQFTYNFNFKVQTTLNIGTQSLDIESSTTYTANNVTVAFDPGPDITLEICDFNNVNLLDLYNELQIQLPVDPTEFNEAEDFGNIFEPENSWYNETDDLEANPDIPPLTEITEPGVYQFNAKKFLEDCSGKPVYVTLVESCDIDLQIKTFLQGASLNPNVGEETLMRDDLRVGGYLPTTTPYIDGLSCNASVFNTGGTSGTGTIDDDIVDWIWIELRDANDNTSILASKSALLQRDGDIVDIDGLSSLSFSIASGNYYIVVNHRNHLGIMTATSLALNESTTVVDFTDGSTDTFGSNAQASFGKPVNVLGMWAGDVNDNGQVRYLGPGNDTNMLKDVVLGESGNNTNSNFYPFMGYHNADINMNGQIRYLGPGNDTNTLKDIILSHPSNGNLSNFFPIGAQIPN